jgi:hypothetical protein
MDKHPDGDKAEGLQPEPRWPVAIAILLLLIIVTILPDRYRLLPAWVPFSIAAIGWFSSRRGMCRR